MTPDRLDLGFSGAVRIFFVFQMIELYLTLDISEMIHFIQSGFEFIFIRSRNQRLF